MFTRLEQLVRTLLPERDNRVIIGSATKRLANIYAAVFTGSVTGNITGNITGNVTGNVTGDVTGNVTGGLTANGGFIREPAPVVTAEDTIAVSAALTGTTYLATKATATQVFTLPAAAVGLTYTFVCGHADGEILIDPTASDDITGKGFATTGATGIKNTAATNAVGDAVTLIAVSATHWVAKSTVGTWAAQ